MPDDSAALLFNIDNVNCPLVDTCRQLVHNILLSLGGSCPKCAQDMVVHDNMQTTNKGVTCNTCKQQTRHAKHATHAKINNSRRSNMQTFNDILQNYNIHKYNIEPQATTNTSVVSLRPPLALMRPSYSVRILFLSLLPLDSSITSAVDELHQAPNHGGCVGLLQLLLGSSNFSHLLFDFCFLTHFDRKSACAILQGMLSADPPCGGHLAVRPMAI